MTKPIYVTKPYLPSLEQFLPYLEKIWKSGILTNNGPMHEKLESALCRYLGIGQISLFTNGTIALVTALKSLRITGEVITTPYSFVATAHALRWNNIKPVFVDIEPRTLNLDPEKIEAAITPETRAILPVHCYGNPCDVDRIHEIAETYNLKVIYDAAHAFGVECHNGSILNHGDLSVLSFHATKVFNTFEGGAIVAPDGKSKRHIDHLKNFGIVDETTVVATGINGKMSEFNAALGLLQLDHLNSLVDKREQIDARYRRAFSTINGIRCISNTSQAKANYSYFPILIEEEFPVCRDTAYEHLRSRDIYARRYFYPLIADLPMYRGLDSAASGKLENARRIKDQVICLPIYPDLDLDSQNRIIDTIMELSS